MKQQSTKDVAINNRRIVVQTILDNGSLSRVELAEKTGLSPSTVTRVIAALMTRGVIAEDTNHIRTVGRSRIPLVINASFGSLGVLSINSDKATLFEFDMGLNQLSKTTFELEVFDAMSVSTATLKQLRVSSAGRSLAPLRAFGILFGDTFDNSSENSCDKSFGEPSAISFDKAQLVKLISSHLDVPVIEEEGNAGIEQMIRTNATAATQDDQAPLNHAVVSFGSRILLTITQDGEPVAFKDGIQTDITSQVFGTGETQAKVIERLSQSLALLATLFNICAVYLLYRDERQETFKVIKNFISSIQGSTGKKTYPSLVPMAVSDIDNVFLMVSQLRQSALYYDILSTQDVY